MQTIFYKWRLAKWYVLKALKYLAPPKRETVDPRRTEACLLSAVGDLKRGWVLMPGRQHCWAQALCCGWPLKIMTVESCREDSAPHLMLKAFVSLRVRRIGIAGADTLSPSQCAGSVSSGAAAMAAARTDRASGLV